MAIVLYKKGSMAKVRGISCEIQICDPFSYQHLLDQGWFLSPEACYARKEKTEVEVIEEKKSSLIKELKAKKAKFTVDKNKE